MIIKLSRTCLFTVRKTAHFLDLCAVADAPVWLVVLEVHLQLVSLFDVALLCTVLADPGLCTCVALVESGSVASLPVEAEASLRLLACKLDLPKDFNSGSVCNLES